MAPNIIKLDSYNNVLQEQWNKNPGVPRAVTKTAGSGWKSCKKKMRRTLAGRENWRTPVTTSLPGAGSTTVASAVANASGMGTDLFDVTVFAEWTQHMEVDWGLIRRSRGDEAYFPRVTNWHMMGHATRAENIHSQFFYQNGGGALARVDPASTVNIGDTVIKLLLPRSGIMFEAERTDSKTGSKSSGDVIEFSVDDGTGGAGTKSFTPKLTGVRVEAGQLVVSPAVPDDGFGAPVVQPGDYIFIRGTYGGAPLGLAAWCPANSAALTAPFFGVNRSELPEKLGGLRIVIPAGRDPRQKWAAICKKAMIHGTRFDRVYTTPEEFEAISNAVATGTMDGKWALTTRMVRSSETEVTVALQVPALQVPNPSTGQMVEVIADEYFYDVSAGESGQALYRGCSSSTFYYDSTADTSFWWVNFDGNGPLYQLPASSIIVATYNIYGQLLCEDPQSLFVAGPNVVP